MKKDVESQKYKKTATSKKVAQKMAASIR